MRKIVFLFLAVFFVCAGVQGQPLADGGRQYLANVSAEARHSLGISTDLLAKVKKGEAYFPSAQALLPKLEDMAAILVNIGNASEMEDLSSEFNLFVKSYNAVIRTEEFGVITSLNNNVGETVYNSLALQLEFIKNINKAIRSYNEALQKEE